jgi:hypothetical protein
VTNQNSGFQGLNKIEASLTVTSGVDPSEAPCTASDFQFTGGGNKWDSHNFAPGADATLTLNPAKDIASLGSYTVPDLDVSMIDSASPQDNCQGATVTVTYTAS